MSVTLSCDSVPEEFTTRALSSGEFATRVRVNSELPARLVKCSPASSVAASSPLLSTTESRSAKLVTLEPRTPLPRLLRIFMRCSVIAWADVRETASCVVLWMVPPLQGSAVVAQAPPVPVTFSPPSLPVELSRMPCVAPLTETASKLRLPGMIRVVSTLSPTPVPVVIVFPVPLTVSLPKLDEVSPWPLVVSMSRPPLVNETSWPSTGLPLLLSATALLAPVLSTFDAPENVVEPSLLPLTTMPPPASPESAMLPEKVTPPPSRPVTSTDWPGPSLIAPS